jgi:hypothetical protein
LPSFPSRHACSSLPRNAYDQLRHIDGYFYGGHRPTGVVGAIIFNNQLNVMQGQLDEMKTASRIAETAAKATKDAADTSREALVKSQRAFVRSIAFPWLWRPDFGRPGKYFFDTPPLSKTPEQRQPSI